MGFWRLWWFCWFVCVVFCWCVDRRVCWFSVSWWCGFLVLWSFWCVIVDCWYFLDSLVWCFWVDIGCVWYCLVLVVLVCGWFLVFYCVWYWDWSDRVVLLWLGIKVVLGGFVLCCVWCLIDCNICCVCLCLWFWWWWFGCDWYIVSFIVVWIVYW